MTNYSLTPAIQWFEGMLLSPQHFQQSDLRFNQILSQHFALLSRHHWGICQLKIDPIVLPDGLLRILELKAVMPDGLIVDYSATMTEIPPLELDLRPFKPSSSQEELVIHIAVPEYISGSSPVIGEFPRYHSVEGSDIKDTNLDDNIVQIPRLLPKIFLHVGEHPPARCLSFPIMKIIFSDESFSQVPYTPPCFFIEKNTPLWNTCAELAQKIREKASYLSEKWQNQIGTPMLQETSNLMRPLVMGLPYFETIIHGDPVHPFLLFQTLSRVVGLLAPLRLSQIPPLMPVYQHAAINACFEPIVDIIKQYINSIELSFAAFPFQQKDRLFYLRLHPSYLQEKLYVGIKGPKGMTESQLEEWMNDCVITSDFAVESVRMRRISGAERSSIHDEELYELMPSRGVIIFEINNNPEYIKGGQNLNIFNPADSSERRPIEIVLYVRKGANA